MDYRGVVLNWLYDTYRMELEIAKILEGHIRDAARFPELQKQVRAHREVTLKQSERLKKLIRSLGGREAELKSDAVKRIAKLKESAGVNSGYRLVTNTIFQYALENLEVAQYRALLDMGRLLNLKTIIRLAEKNLNEEEYMASYLRNQMLILMKEYLTEFEKKG